MQSKLLDSKAVIALVGTAPLLSWLKGLRQRVASETGPILASICLPINPDQDVAPAGAGRLFVWQRPDRGEYLTGTGVAAEWRFEGAEAIRQVRQQAQALLARAVVEVTTGAGDTGPLCFSGFAFDPQGRDRDGVWQGFADGWAVVPSLLLIRRPQESALVITVTADQCLNPDAEALRLEAEIANFFAASPDEAAPTPVACVAHDDQARVWGDTIDVFKQHIEDGDAVKIVLARRVGLTNEGGFSLPRALERLGRRYANCNIFAIGDGDSTFLGATPEMLVSLQDNLASIDCLAGSAPRGCNEAEDASLARALRADEKELWEHDLVRRGIEQALRGVTTRLDVPTTPIVRSTASVQHLYTPMQAQVAPGHGLLDLVERLHPTPATAGLPRESALALIREQEGFDRGWYAGPLGWFDRHGNGEFAVALRSALVRGSQAWLFAGCGIVAGSDPEREYRESQVKMEAMLWALGSR